MRVLLLAMPDTVSAMDAITRMPNLGLCSLAGNLEDSAVGIVDLAFHPRGLSRYIREVITNFQPDIIGLSAMSHQYASAGRVARICREVRPGAKIVLGGYHASLLYREIAAGADAGRFDFLIRGEGELTLPKLVQALNLGSGFAGIPGLSYRQGGEFHHNPDAPLLDLATLRLPNRDCRLIDEARFLGEAFDCVETSRGCTLRCRFCSIGLMYGHTQRLFPLERVITELKQLKERGKKGVFFVDDNITQNVPRLRQLCELMVKEKLNTLSYIIQAGVPGIASDPDLAVWLRKAGFKWVFLGIENGIARNLESMGKAGVLQNTRRAVTLLKDQGIGVFGGFIIGHPEDARADVARTYRFALELGVDHPIIQCLTPYPGTETRGELLARGLITNAADFSLYNGFTANVRTEHLSRRQLNRAIFAGGLRLYFHPRYLARSRFWHYRLSLLPVLLLNNLRYLAGALRGRIFISRHRW